MPAILGKSLAKLTGTQPIRPNQDPSDDEIIRHLDYDRLEQELDVHKYYPKFLHNYDYSTPQIKEMIGDKPVYSKANRKNKSGNKNIAEFDAVTGEVVPAASERKTAKKLEKALKKDLSLSQAREKRAQKKEHREQKKELREEYREEKKQLHQAYKDERRAEKEESRKLMREHMNQRRKSASNSKSTDTFEPIPFPKSEDPAADFTFRDPFQSNQSTLVPSRQKSHLAQSRKNSIRTLDRVLLRKPSLSLKLRDMVLLKRHEEKTDNLLERTNSYDQTKSTMTSVRGAQNDLLRFDDRTGRRMSETIGTYIFSFFFFHPTVRS